MHIQTKTSAGRLVRKQVLLTPDQNAGLKRLASISGRSEGDLVRGAVETMLETSEASAEDWKVGLRSIAGMWAGRDDLDQIYAERRKRRGQRRDQMNRWMRGEA